MTGQLKEGISRVQASQPPRPAQTQALNQGMYMGNYVAFTDCLLVMSQLTTAAITNRSEFPMNIPQPELS